MYRLLKRILVLFSFVLIAVVGILFLNHFKSEMLGGYSEIVYIQRSSTTISSDLEEIAKTSDSVLARRIVAASQDGKSANQNTYIAIGGDLPADLPLQEDKERIQNASYNGLYLIVKGKLTAGELVQELSKKGHESSVMPANSGATLLKLFFIYPQSITVALILLVALVTLTLAEYIAGIRSVSIERLSGQGKYQIALKITAKDSLFFVASFLVVLTLTVLALLGLQNLTYLSFTLIAFPLFYWLFLLLVGNFLFSNIFYHVLQKQPLNLSIKGKAPMRLIFVLVIVTQLLALSSVMYSVYGVAKINREITTLEQGLKKWKDYPERFATVGIDNGEEKKEDSEVMSAFLRELNEKTNLLHVGTNLDSIARSDAPNKNSYYPTPEGISNEIKVNRRFVEQSGITLSPETKDMLDNLGDYDRLVLIPKSQEANFDQLKAAWLRFEEKGFAPDDAPVKHFSPDDQIQVSSYQGGENLFIYPIFTSASHLLNREAFVHEPIIVVYGSAYVERKVKILSLAQYVFGQPEVVKETIQKYHLTTKIGSFTNGIYSFEMKIQKVSTDRILLFVAMVISLASSLLLMIMLNTLYLYQGRKDFFIERLAGKSLYQIHRRYFLFLTVGHLLLAIISLLLHAPILVVLLPLLYILVFIGLFVGQLQKNRKANVLYLKGG